MPAQARLPGGVAASAARWPAAAEPLGDRRGGFRGAFELGHVAHRRQYDQRPGRVRAHGRPAAATGTSRSPLAVQQQYRAADRPDCLAGRPGRAAYAGGGDRPSGWRAAKSRPASVNAARWRATSTCWATTSAGTRDGVRAAQRQDVGHGGLRGHPATAARAAPGRALASRTGRTSRRPRIGPDRHERQGRVDQDQAGDRAGRRARLEQRDHPAHRVAHQDHRAGRARTR